jgi:hypothetical protein
MMRINESNYDISIIYHLIYQLKLNHNLFKYDCEKQLCHGKASDTKPFLIARALTS